MLQLNVPAPRQDAALTFTDPAAVIEWLAALPYAQTQACAHQLITQLEQLNNSQLATELRARLLSLYQQAGDRLLPALGIEARPSEISHTPRARQAAVLTLALLQQLHLGDKLLAIANCQGTPRFFNSKTRYKTLAQAMRSARDLAWASTRYYTPLPAGFWQDSHRMAAYTTQLGDSNTDKSAEDLGVLYRQLLLLGITNSNRFSSAEQEHLLMLIRKYAFYIQLQQHQHPPANTFIFVFHPDLDSPPRFLAELPLRGEQWQWWQADTSLVLQQLQERISSLARMQLAHPEQETEEEKQLSQRLRQQWEYPAHRRHPRLPLRVPVQLVSQLAPVWFVANKASWTLTGLPQAEAQHHAEPELDVAVDDEDFIPALIRQITRPLPPPPSTLDLINTSSNGMMLRGLAQHHPLRCGEIILLHEPNQAWQLGVVRWVNLLQPALRIETGIELLSPGPEAIMTRPVITHPTDRFQMALRLPAFELQRHPPLLLLPGRQFEKQREIRILDQHGESHVRLTTLFMQTAHYQLVEFKQNHDA